MGIHKLPTLDISAHFLQKW